MGKDNKGKELGVGFTQRKDGLYQARFTHNGQRHCLYDKKFKGLREKVIVVQTEAKDGLDGTMKKVSLDEWFQHYYDTCIVPFSKDSTIKNAMVDYNRCKDSISNKNIVDIKQSHVQMVVNEMQKKNYKASTLMRSFKILRRLFDFAIDNDIIFKNPCKNVIVPKLMGYHQRVMTIDEQDTFIEAIEDDFYHNLLMVLLSTGLRIGEATGLSWDSVDFVNEEIKINRTLVTGSVVDSKIKFSEPKTFSSIRNIPITDDVKGYLENQRIQQDLLRKKLGNKWRGKNEFDNLVFTTSFGSPILNKVIGTHINNIVKAINYNEIVQARIDGREPIYFDSLSPHAFRRSFATRAFEQGMKPKNVQKLLGHFSIETTLDIYTKVVGDELKKDLEKYQVKAKCVNVVYDENVQYSV